MKKIILPLLLLSLNIFAGAFEITVLNDSRLIRRYATVIFKFDLPAKKICKETGFIILDKSNNIIPVEVTTLERSEKTVLCSAAFPAELAPGKNIFTLKYGKDIVGYAIDGAFYHLFRSPQLLWETIKSTTGKTLCEKAVIIASDKKNQACQIKFDSNKVINRGAFHRVIQQKGEIFCADRRLLLIENTIHTYSRTPAIDIEVVLTNPHADKTVELAAFGIDCQTVEDTPPFTVFSDDSKCFKENMVYKIRTKKSLTLKPQEKITKKFRIAAGSEREFPAPPTVSVSYKQTAPEK